MGKVILDTEREDGSTTYFVSRTRHSFWVNTLAISSVFWVSLLLGILILLVDSSALGFILLIPGLLIFILLEYAVCIRKVGVIIGKDIVTVRQRFGQVIMNRNDIIGIRAIATDPAGRVVRPNEVKHYIEFERSGGEQPVIAFFDLNFEQITQVRTKIALDLGLL